MTVSRIIDAVRVRDQLGKPDSKGLFGPFRKQEKLRLTETYTIVKNRNVAGEAIWDNPGTTWDGPDLNDTWGPQAIDGFILNSGAQGICGENTLGESSETFTVIRIINPNNTYIERFAFSTLEGASSTATWDTTNRQVDFTAGQVLEIVSAFKDSSSTQTVVSATLNVTVESGTFTYEMSADGGVNWQTATNNTTLTFTNQGSDLRIRVTQSDDDAFPTMFGTWGSTGTGTITKIVCAYTLGT